ncbi:MAG: hypothetical protein LBP56_09135 [Odoribacteraceae bacterium]|jgi:hypothetical protein|nr:hypothetical protein [Odoribacteraceae bacterium]
MFHVLFTARNEFRLLSRDRGLQGVVLFLVAFIAYFHVYYQYKILDWGLIGLPASFPLVNAILSGFAQCLMAPLVAMSFVHRSRDVDSVQVFLCRPTSNGQQVAGKAVGIFAFYLVYNLLFITPALVINLLFSPSPFRFSYYIFYTLTLGIPSFLFLSGVAAMLATVTRNKGILLLFFFLLVILLLTLSGVFHGMLDFSYHAQPNLFSTIAGFPAPGSFFLHRLAYSCLGIASWIMVARQFPRLPNVTRSRGYNTRGAVTFLLLAVALLGTRDTLFQLEDRRRAKWRACQVAHETGQQPIVVEHAIECELPGERLQARSRMTLENRTGTLLPVIHLYLNPGLKAGEITVEWIVTPYRVKGQVITVERAMAPGERVIVEMSYEGKIDETVCYLDVEDHAYHHATQASLLMTPGNRYAFLEKDLTILTPECLWYPVTVPPVSLVTGLSPLQFSSYSLKVKAGKGVVVLSQGKGSREGEYHLFQEDHPLTAISLYAGKVHGDSLALRGRLFELYRQDKKDFLAPALRNKRFTAQLADYLERTADRYHQGAGKEFLLSGLVLVESPVSLRAHERIVTRESHLVQPGMVFYPERLVSAARLDWICKNQDGEEALGEEKVTLGQSTSLYDVLVQEKLRSLQYSWSKPFIYESAEHFNSWYLYPALDRSSCFIYSPDVPVTGRLLEEVGQATREWTSTPTVALSGQLAYSREVISLLATRSLQEIVTMDLTPKMRTLLFRMKGAELSRRIEQRIDRKNWFEFMEEFYARHRYQNVPLDSLSRETAERFGLDLKQELASCYTGRGLPVYIIKDMRVERVQDEQRLLFAVHFKAWNQGSVEGTLETYLYDYRKYDHHLSYNDLPVHRVDMPPGSCKEVRAVLEGAAQHFFVYTGYSGNFPTRQLYYLTSPLPVTTDTSTWAREIDSSHFMLPAHEIVVDNSDPGFHAHEANSRRWLDRFRKMRMQWNSYAVATFNWQPFANSACYKDPVREAFALMTSGGKAYAQWSTNLPEKGSYEVFVYGLNFLIHDGFSSFIKENKRSFRDVRTSPYKNHVQCYTIYHDHGTTDVSIDFSNTPQGWVSAGIFQFNNEPGKVILHDRSFYTGQCIFADAIKWVKVAENASRSPEE